MNTSGLHSYQRAHAEQVLTALRQNSAALDASDTGTGKTYAALAIAREMGIAPLVICPKPTISAWEEVSEKMGVEAEIVNFEKIRSPKSEYGREIPYGSGSKWVWNFPVELAIWDEVQRCGGTRTLNSKMLIAGKRQFRYNLMLSATAASCPQHCKALGFALGLFPLADFRWWLLRHGCYPGVFGGFEFTCDPDEQNKAMLKINTAIFPGRGSRLRKSEIPGFPKTQIAVRLLHDAPAKAKKLTEELSEAYSARRTQEEETEHHLTKLTRCRQALELLMVGDLAEMATDYAQTSRVAIFLNFSETLDALRKVLAKSWSPEEVGVFDGRNVEERDAYRRCFQADYKIRFLLINVAAGEVGIGIQGQEDRTTLIAPCFSARMVKQILGRVNRIGGGFSQQFFVYFAKTRQAKIAANLTQKLNNLDALNDAELHGVFAE